jgi:hypothetical protein
MNVFAGTFIPPEEGDHWSQLEGSGMSAVASAFPMPSPTVNETGNKPQIALANKCGARVGECGMQIVSFGSNGEGRKDPALDPPAHGPGKSIGICGIKPARSAWDNTGDSRGAGQAVNEHSPAVIAHGVEDRSYHGGQNIAVSPGIENICLPGII